ncbi:unnamed protein product [Onchocerca ochengi]|uniref:Uncharacterized protein n=1 Tax=Onchocerca ochengi TaxID=42157 RepID=A0A182EDG2_ONCOC|nr:unnamed protein product [Onchocerca ochengi]
MQPEIAKPLNTVQSGKYQYQYNTIKIFHAVSVVVGEILGHVIKILPLSRYTSLPFWAVSNVTNPEGLKENLLKINKHLQIIPYDICKTIANVE